LKIKENDHEGYESYSSQLQEQVNEIFQYAYQLSDMKDLITTIKKEAINLQALFVSEEERKKKEAAVRFFDARMQATVYYTLKNFEVYSQQGWKQLVDEGNWQ
jgi:hypothetical protein